MERQHLEELAIKDKQMSIQITEAVVIFFFCIICTHFKAFKYLILYRHEVCD